MIRTVKQSFLGSGVRAALLVSASTLWSTGAFAQTQPAAPAVNQQAEPADDAEIIVTAQRREERLQDVPAAITAFTGATLERLNTTDSTEIAKMTPGLTLGYSTITPQPTIRGIGSRGLSAGEESSVPIYIDGVYQPAMVSSSFLLSSIDRIEVLKGPQGALYGRNSTGGAINVITHTPGEGFQGSGSISYGRFDEVVAKATAGGGSDTLAADISGVYLTRGAYLHDLVTNTQRGGVDQYAVRGKIVWRPAPNVNFVLADTYSVLNDYTSQLLAPVNRNTIGRRYVPTPVVSTGGYSIAAGQDSKFHSTQNSISLTGDVNLGGVSLTGIASFVKLDYVITNANNDGVAPLIFRGDNSLDGKYYYNEIYLQSTGNRRFNWIVGAVYYDGTSDYDYFRSFTLNLATNLGTLTLRNNGVNTRSIAGYAQGTFKITPELSLTLGGRYTSERSVLSIRNYQSATAPSFFTPTLATVPLNTQGRGKWDQFTPSANLQYKFSDTLNVYAKVGRGFKSGIFSASGRSTLPANPELITQYELGLKSQPLPWLRVNVSAYHSKYTDMQVTARDPVTQAAFLQNAAAAIIKGGELEVVVTPVRGLALNGGVAIADGRYDSFPGAQVTIPATNADPTPATTCTNGTGTLIGGNRSVFCDVSGKRLLRTPVATFNLGASYSIEMNDGSKIGLNGNVYHQSEFYWDALNRLREPSQTLVDAEITFTPAGAPVTIGVWGKNLTNDYYRQSLTTSALADIALPALPRTYGIRLSGHF